MVGLPGIMNSEGIGRGLFKELFQRCDTLGSDGDEYEDACHVGCCSA
jgi:hypothetical protein